MAMQLFVDSLIAEWHNLLQVLPRILIAIVTLIISIMIGRVLGSAVERVIKRSKLPKTHGKFFRRLVIWTIVFFGAIMALNMVGLRAVAAGLVTGGGVTAVVVGFAFREIGENFLAGFFLAFSRPFKVGDLIESDGLRGTVRSIDLRNTHVRSADGRDIFIPSAQLFKAPLINFTRDGLRRFSFTIGIDYGDDPTSATRLLFDAVSSVEGVLNDPGPGVIMGGLLDAWVQLEVFYWIDTFDTNNSVGKVQTAAMSVVRETLRNHGFTVSSDTISNVALRAAPQIAVAMNGQPAA